MAATKVEQTDVEAFAIEIQSMLEGRDLKGKCHGQADHVNSN
jgi:hypothetical protein